jgi:hypothetical protein
LPRPGTGHFHFSYQPFSIVTLACTLAPIAEDNKDDKGKFSTVWFIQDETLLIKTLVQQKIAGNWGDNNPKKAAWTACKTALAGGDKSAVVPKSVNTIKNCWQRVSLFLSEYMRIYSNFF